MNVIRFCIDKSLLIPYLESLGKYYLTMTAKRYQARVIPQTSQTVIKSILT